AFFFLSPAKKICSRLLRFLLSEITTFTSIIEHHMGCIAVSKKNHEKNPQNLKIGVFVTVKQYFESPYGLFHKNTCSFSVISQLLCKGIFYRGKKQGYYT